jgi:imidazolonepropionase
MSEMNNKQWDSLWLNGRLATFENSYGLVENGAVAVKDGRIAWVGPADALGDLSKNLARDVHDLGGHWLTPGLIDCHTHLVYAGNRYAEFEMRLQGASYASIAEAGGGIQSTVKATRAATENELFQQSMQRARRLAAEGVTTVEIKSGYGLDLETELKILRVAKRIGESLPLTVVPTFLGAHALPLEYKTKPDEYIDRVCHEMLPALLQEGLVQHVDVFCENIAFDLAQTERVFKTAREFGLRIKCHAEQLSDLGASSLAAKYQALSVDHLEFLSSAGVAALAKSGTVAVLLPGAFYFLRETQFPPIELLREHGVPIAIATDSNPGTSPVTSLLLMLSMACTLFKLTPAEALLGVTKHAAEALGLGATCGTLTVGKQADFCIWDIDHPAELAYRVGYNPLIGVVKGGEVVSL